jgi:uncharacterized membrane protein YcaP (DUF421 family)
MDVITNLFGEGNDLNALQMSCRAIVIFLISLVLIRIAGRRSFSLHAAFDNIIVILLGAILSRTVVGVSPFIPTIVACFVISVLHRLFGIMSVYYPSFENVIKGKKILLYQDGVLFKEHFRRSLTTENDILEEVRLTANVDSLDKIKTVYMEKNGRISAVKK